MAGMSDLPVELFGQCFAFLPFQDVIRVSHVSRLWRAMASAQPELWRRLEFHHHPHQRATFLSILERTGTIPLEATWLHVESERAGLDLLETVLPRVSVLTIIGDDQLQDDKGLLDRLLGHPLPSLTEFHLDWHIRFSIQPHWSGSVPNLRVLAVSGSIVFDPTGDPFPELRVLRGSLGESRAPVQDPRIIFGLCPNLVELELSFTNQRLLNCLSDGPILTKLRRLCFWDHLNIGWFELNYQPLMDVLGRMPAHFAANRASDICAVVTHYTTHVGAPFRMSCHIRYTTSDYFPSVLELHMESEGPDPVVCHSSAAPVRGPRGVLASAPRLVPLLQNLARLECAAGFLFCLQAFSPTLPSLHSLTIFFYGRGPHGDPKRFHQERDGRLHAPRLRSLALDTAGMEGVFTFDPRAWFADALSAENMRLWLSFDAPRLETASLCVRRRDYESHGLSAFSGEALAHRVQKVSVGWRADEAEDGPLQAPSW